MTYIVTHGLGTTAIEQRFDLEGALAHAHELLLDGKQNVVIQDGNGRSISGADLIACCNGLKKLTHDLRTN